ncbi:hypothetical protein Acr_07g0017060 [Actinidia rufa]|uniref:Retrotransposon gag domain-containing protein n=1 Tax=Actinidia rufa TaxID=165716 RepID=A0A7J0EYK7_9ERIC|nr:hypothetical protein Acr_07g0017060 [Actinidia rufa]
MPPRNARGRAKSYTGARGARGACGARRNLDEGDDHQESLMGGRASALVENVGNVGVPDRTAESTATTAVKAFLQLRPPTFKGEPDLLVIEDWLEQVTRALDTILVTEEELRVLFASYQLQGDALQWWKTVEEVGAKKWEPFKKADLFWLSSIGSSCYGLPTEESAAAITVGGTISHPGTGTITSQRATYLLLVWSGWSYQSTVHTEGEQSGSYRITTTYSAVAQQGQRTQGQFYVMTSAEGPSGTTGQQEQQLDTSVVRGFKVEVLDLVLMLDTPVGGRTILRRICRSCEIEIGDRRFVFDFIVLDMTSFDIILGMDRLTGYHATIDCVRHRVTFCTSEGDHFHFVGD